MRKFEKIFFLFLNFNFIFAAPSSARQSSMKSSWETMAESRAPKTDENDLLIFIFVDSFSKSLVDYLFLLIFQQISTNKQIQQKQINK